MPTWPGSLPRRPPPGQWQVEIIDPTVRNNPDVGPPMTRKRATTDWAIFKGTYVLSRADYRTLYLFWRDDCEHGSLSFTGPDWVTEDAVSLQWGGPPNANDRFNSLQLDCPVSFIRRPVT